MRVSFTTATAEMLSMNLGDYCFVNKLFLEFNQHLAHDQYFVRVIQHPDSHECDCRHTENVRNQFGKEEVACPLRISNSDEVPFQTVPIWLKSQY